MEIKKLLEEVGVLRHCIVDLSEVKQIEASGLPFELKIKPSDDLFHVPVQRWIDADRIMSSLNEEGQRLHSELSNLPDNIFIPYGVRPVRIEMDAPSGLYLLVEENSATMHPIRGRELIAVQAWRMTRGSSLEGIQRPDYNLFAVNNLADRYAVLVPNIQRVYMEGILADTNFLQQEADDLRKRLFYPVLFPQEVKEIADSNGLYFPFERPEGHAD